MTKEETIKIMAMLGAFYGAGKSNPEVMADGWYMILQPYNYNTACKGVLSYAKNDTREYGTYPTVGNIVKAIEEEMSREEAPIKETVRAVSYGWGYDQLSKGAQNIISEDAYNEWLKMNAEEFSSKASVLADALRDRRKRLQE